MDHDLFRRLFSGLLQATHKQEDIQKLLFYPAAPLLVAPAAASPQTYLDQVTARMRTLDPVHLYQAGLRVPLNPIAPQAILNVLRSPGRGMQERLTLIVVPGVLGEFINTPAFEDVFALPHSSYRSHWQERIAAIKRAATRDPRYATLLTDPSFELQALKHVDTPMEELMNVGSIDDVNGVPLVNLILFNTKRLSLESLGDVTEKAKFFSRRLTKFFGIAGTPKNIAFVGYSRGAIVALDMLAQAHAKPRSAPWLQSVRGLISLGGVVYGSDLADEAVNSRNVTPAPVVAARLQALKAHADELKEIPPGASFIDKAIILKDNFFSRTRFLSVIVKTLLHEGGELNGWSRALSTIKGVIKGIREIDLNDPIGVIREVLVSGLRLDLMSKEYNENIRRAKVLVYALITAVSQLSTHNRMQWWAQKIVPTQGIRYYGLTGTMTDASVDSPISRQLAGNNISYNTQLLDYALTLSSYRDYRAASGVLINDSQVAAHKVRFWPELNRLLNPAQPPLDTAYLGVVHADHWGLALRVVNQANTRNQQNPFPRVQLLQSLAASVIIDLTAKH